MSKLVSIVLPVYNGARFLRDSIESIIGQTYTNWELLILDDCSTDDTPIISIEYTEKDERIHYYRNEKNLRLPGNLNRGFSLSVGEYLTWTSDDNLFRPMALERMVDALESNTSVDLVYSSYQIIDEFGVAKQVYAADIDGQNHILGSNVVGACFMYTRKVYEQVGDYDVNLFLVEDFDYWQRVMMKFRSLPVAEVLYYYRWHDASLTSTKNELRFSELLEKMLLKNRPGFGRLSFEASHAYYSALARCCKAQKKKNPHAVRFALLHACWKCKNILAKLGG